MRTFKDIRESAKGMVGGFSVEIPKQTISGKTIGGGKNGIFVKAKTARQAISMAAKRLGVDFKMLKVGKVIKESVGGCECEDCKCDPCTCSTCPAPLDEAYQQFLDKTPNWGEDKAISYGRKKGYKEIGVVGYGKIDGIVLFGLDAGDKSYVGKEAKVKTGQTVFRYATSRTVAGDIFPLVKIDVKKGLLYHLSQKSSEGEIEHAEFETKSSKLRYLRLLSTANLRDITGFDPGFGSMKESVDLEEGKMKEFHAMVKKGMTAAQIAKKIGMKEKDVAEFMKGMKESTDLEEKKDSPKEFEKKVVHTVSIMKKYPANKNKSDAVLRKGAIKYLTQKPRGASDDWNESLDLARLKLLLGR
jgi:predicted transcriptional regulator